MRSNHIGLILIPINMIWPPDLGIWALNNSKPILNDRVWECEDRFGRAQPPLMAFNTVLRIYMLSQ